MITQLQSIKSYYNSGATKSYTFRKQQLIALKNAIKKYETEIANALYTDLKKSAEEAYATEIGIVLQEINYTLSNLKHWMQPQKVGTDLLNLPSSSKIYKDAWGVVLIIAPWNYPFQLLLNPLIGAIAGGNCAVIKPSEYAVATSIVVEKICTEIFASNYIYVAQGIGATIIPTLMQNFRFDYVFYTGSVPVGKAIYKMAAENLTPVTLELGGKSPCIVCSDANLKVAAQRIVLGKFVNAGQTCIAPDYILVEDHVKQKLIDELIIAIEKFYTKNALNSYDYGKIINEQRFTKLISYLNNENVAYGGNHNKNLLYIQPTILQNCLLQSPIMQEEIFGPILPILSYKNNQEALSIVQQNENPLAFYIFTTNKKTENYWLQNVAFGGGCINNTVYHFSNNNFPFGGVGNSGIGAYHGKHSFNTFTRLKPVLKTPNWFNPAIKYPSFKGKLKLFRWFFK